MCKLKIQKQKSELSDIRSDFHNSKMKTQNSERQIWIVKCKQNSAGKVRIIRCQLKIQRKSENCEMESWNCKKVRILICIISFHKFFPCQMWPWTTKQSLVGIFVAIAKNTMYGSKFLLFLLCQTSLGY